MLDINPLVRYYNGAVTERYRSGHNEAVLKTVCPQGRVGSNPTLSASRTWNKNTSAEIPKWFKGLPWKGSRPGDRCEGSNPSFCVILNDEQEP